MEDLEYARYCLQEDIEFDMATGKQYPPHPTPTAHVLGLDLLTPEQRQKVTKAYKALYVDGYGILRTKQAFIHLLEDAVHVIIGDKPESNAEFNVSYPSLQSLNVTLEREITALRTYLLGPALAAWFKKKTRFLTIGFSNELGLLEAPTFKLSDYDIDDCYQTIMDRIRETKASLAMKQRGEQLPHAQV